MDDDEGRATLAAYLPATEPPDASVAQVISRARTVRRNRRAVLGSAASVVAVLGFTAVALGPGGGPAPQPGSPPSASASSPAERPTASVLPSGAAPPAGGCQEENSSTDPGARAWARWVRGKVAGLRPQAGPAERIQMCELDMGYTVIPPHLMNSATFTLPLAGGVTGTDSLTAAIDRWDRLPDQYRTPCKDDLITEHVVCHQRTLTDGSRLVQRDFYDILIHGDPDDQNARRDKHAVRDVTRILPGGRTVSIGLGYNGSPAWKRSFDRHVLSLDELTAIVTDPGALRHFPSR
jgi:hypothetical protein